MGLELWQVPEWHYLYYYLSAPACSTGLLLDFTESNSTHMQPSQGPMMYPHIDSQTLPHSLQHRTPFSLPCPEISSHFSSPEIRRWTPWFNKTWYKACFIFPSLCQERASNRTPGWLSTSQLWSQSTAACCFMSKKSCFAYFVQFYSYYYWESSSYLIMAGSRTLTICLVF